jgi:hypothetical protein
VAARQNRHGRDADGTKDLATPVMICPLEVTAPPQPLNPLPFSNQNMEILGSLNVFALTNGLALRLSR